MREIQKGVKNIVAVKMRVKGCDSVDPFMDLTGMNVSVLLTDSSNNIITIASPEVVLTKAIWAEFTFEISVAQMASLADGLNTFYVVINDGVNDIEKIKYENQLKVLK